MSRRLRGAGEEPEQRIYDYVLAIATDKPRGPGLELSGQLLRTVQTETAAEAAAHVGLNQRLCSLLALGPRC